ncbi:MAG: tetratricopeptide repeat protein [Phycisphaerae bacterium]
MKRKRLFLLFVTLGLCVVLGIGGVLWWLYQNTGSRLLRRADLAIQANNHGKAIGMLDRYIADRPHDWTGYYHRSRALVGLGRFDDARDSLDQAAKANPREVSVPLLFAETYQQQARQLIGAKELPKVRQAVTMFEAALGALAGAKAPDAKRAIDVLERRGMAQVELAGAYRRLAARLRSEADATRNEKAREALLSETEAIDPGPAGQPSTRPATMPATASAPAGGKREMTLRDAIATLLEAVTKDPSRATAAATLVELCLDLKDQPSLAKAREAILRAEDPAPVAAMMLTIEDLETSAGKEGPGPVNREKLQEACRFLDAIIDRHRDDKEPRQLEQVRQVKIRRAELALRASDLKTAKSLCDDVLKADTRNPEARLTLATVLGQEGDIDAAEKVLQGLRRDFPKWPEPQYAYGRLALQAGRTSAALDALRAMASQVVDDPRAQQTHKLRQAELALAVGETATAGRLVDEVLASQPGNPSAYLIKGNVLAANGDLNGAAQGLLALKTAYPRWPQALLAYARVADRKGNLPDAIAAARDASALDPGNTSVLKYLADLRIRASDFDNALAGAQALLKDRPDDPVAIRLFTEAAGRTNQAEPAKKALDKIAADYPGRADVLLAVADGYDSLGDRASAVKVAQKAVAATQPASLDGRLAVAQALQRVDRLPEAEKLLTDELKKDPSQARTHMLLGQLLARTGRTLPAIDQYRLAVEDDRGNSEYRTTLARALMDSGDMAECQKVLDTVDSSSPSANALRLQLRLIQGQQVPPDQLLQWAQGPERSAAAAAMLYFARGQFAECEDLCRKELARKPDDQDARWLLGRALVAQGGGKQEEGIGEWEKVVQKSPDRMPLYLEMARVLGDGGDVDQAARRLAAVPGAQRDMVDFAVGSMLATSGQHDKAVEVLAGLVGRPGAPDHVRGQAHLVLAFSYGGAGQIDKAVAECDKLLSDPAWRKQALSAKARALAIAARTDEASAALDQLRRLAQEENDTAVLRDAAQSWAAMRLYDKALATCDALLQSGPDDARNWQLKAALLAANGKGAEAAQAYRKAIELQPGNYALYTALAGSLDAQRQTVEALEVLRRLEDAGPAGATVALFNRGLLLAGWGLPDQAADCLTRVANMGYGGNPQVRLTLGQAFARMGQADRAAEFLKPIPVWADQYVPAQLLLAQLAPTTEARLAIIGELRKSKPDNQEVLIQEMAVLMRAGKPSDAAKAFQEYAAKNIKAKAASSSAPRLAAQAMLESGDRSAARDLAVEIARSSGDAGWRLLGALLLADEDPSSAMGLLPESGKADLWSATMGVCLAARTNDAAARMKWLARLAEIDKQMDKARPGALAAVRLLICLSTGQSEQAKGLVDSAAANLGIGGMAAREIVSSAASNPKSAEEASSLLKSTVALDMGLPALARGWAIGLAKARPACQWAALLAFQGSRDKKEQEEVLGLLEPKDCPLALALNATLMRREGYYAKSADLWARAAKTDPSPELILNQARDTEFAGRPAEALALYRKHWESTKTPTAANNVAYLTSQLYPKDTAKLDEARKMIEDAVAKEPANAAFRDTLGWILYLEGQNEKACMELRAAIKGDPMLPPVHYHLALAEAACGRLDLARWHHGAAVSIGKAIQAQGRPVSAEMAQSIKLAQEALSALGPEK